jgi:glycine dehydrogenase subunit 2
MAQILREAAQEPELLRRAPHTLPVRRLDDVRAAREPDLIYKSDAR